ncbi:MAG: polysaccharide pyruvyl transferase family protein [Muribaculaceae bacterium]|nr:polysaccharide pyruvyl transferase family protein [Muribaculaceae bacterium]
MKIATITCHDVYNYGASLQAYALQEYCRSLGCDYEIIDYKPPYLSNHYKLWSVANPVYDKPVVKQLYLAAKLPGRLSGLKRKRLFDVFRDKYFRLTPIRYASADDIAKDCPDADVFIAGSDQIWNTFFQNGRDKAFYLDFVGNKGRKISYAASFATEKIYNDAEQDVAKWLKNFDAVSVRESSALDLLSSLGREDGVLVSDPVFLLDRKRWEDLASDSSDTRQRNFDYIFLYDCEQSAKLRDIAIGLKAMSGCKIVAVSSTKGKYADENCSLSGPLEFLKLIKNSKYVVANSFHALAFALIFHKPFFIVNRSEGINTRMRDFLRLLSLDERLIDSQRQLFLGAIDYDKVDGSLAKLINDSKEFIHTQIVK